MRELEVVVIELLAAHRTLAEDRATEHRARASVWNNMPPETSVAARDREVEFATADLHAITLTDDANLRALEAERDYLIWKAEHALITEAAYLTWKADHADNRG